MLAASEATNLLYPAFTGTWSPAHNLPLQLSDVSSLVVIWALVRARPSPWADLGYLWGAPAGTLGLAFPAIGAASPSPLYFAFYANHWALLLGAICLAGGSARSLGWRSVGGAWLATMALAVLAGAANWAVHGDYLFLRQPPTSWSPLLVMGPWPWYVVGAWFVCPLLFLALAWPRWRSRSAADGATALPAQRSRPRSPGESEASHRGHAA
ncbi:MAG TPA: YwaF family protein [Candidatus Dormibacteraeota bacterium]